MIKTKNRLIRTKIPAPGTDKIISSISKHESRSMHGQLPIIWKSARNFNIFDNAGNKFIDFTSTIFVTNIGHSNQKLKKKLIKLLNGNLMHSYAYANAIKLEYIKKLLSISKKHFEKVFLLSAGTEATDAALKLMRLYGQSISKRKLGIICLEGNWHGRTMGAQLMSGNVSQKKWIGFKDKNIHHLPFPYPWTLEDKKIDPKKFLKNSLKNLEKKIDIKNDICGVMLETFQGWGALFYPQEYVKQLHKICKKNKILLCFDEMQSGFARTGKMFGYEHYGIKPDLICVGKGMGGGVPISGVLGKKYIMDLPDVGNMSSTHSSNPISCTAGISVLEEIEDKKIVKNTALKSKILFKYLKNIQNKNNNIIYIGGKGLVAALIFKKTKKINYLLKEVCMECMRKGLLVVYTGRESIKIGPPLTISAAALKEGLQILENSVNKIFNEK
jgi:4-aminobutyrate aminotransferase/(S)-3-amino-2-methylpropionate transaminase